MWWTAIRCSHSVLSSGLPIKNLLPKKLPPSLSSRPGNLYEVISRAPGGGVGKQVHQVRWSEKKIPNSYWVITRSKFKCEGKHGKAWGKLYWKSTLLSSAVQSSFDVLTIPDKLVSTSEERIRGSLKYTWREGASIARTSVWPICAVCPRLIILTTGFSNSLSLQVQRYMC